MNLVESPEYGRLMTINEFLANVKFGAFIPADGTGYWATVTHEDWDSSVWGTKKPFWATHVRWYNK